MDSNKPELWVLTGPNGAGKSTFGPQICRDFYQKHRRHLYYFNPDEEMTRRSCDVLEVLQTFYRRTARSLMRARSDILIETTVPGKTIDDLITEVRGINYKIGVIALGVATSDLAKESVRRRKNNGGHDVPNEVTEVTYQRCQETTPHLIVSSDEAHVYDRDATGSLTEILSFVDGDLFMHVLPEAVRSNNPYMTGLIHQLSLAAPEATRKLRPHQLNAYSPP